ncbi:MAG: diphthine--ammonia ligase [archaeon]
MRKKVAVLFSGGKDSCLALYKVRTEYDVGYLLNISPKNIDSFMFHKPYLNLLKIQASELGIELITKKSEGVEEKELKDLRNLIGEVKDKIEGIVVGGIASNYQGKRIRKVCDELGLEFIAPLWDYSPEKLWDELLENNFQIILTKISCEGLSRDWLGKIIDKNCFEELRNLSKKYKFRIDFEGGEAESAVLFMPGFNKKIEIDFDVESGGEYRYLMKDVKIK